MTGPRRRRGRRSGLVPVRAVLERVASDWRVPEPDAAALIVDPQRWRDVVGHDLADSGEPVRLADGVLTIAARDELGEMRLRMSAEAIRLTVNEAVGSDVVSRVSVQRRR